MYTQQNHIDDLTAENEALISMIEELKSRDNQGSWYRVNFYAVLLTFYGVMFLMLALGWSHVLPSAWDAVTASALVGIITALVIYLVERGHE